jgi:hypothetical protein
MQNRVPFRQILFGESADLTQQDRGFSSSIPPTTTATELPQSFFNKSDLIVEKLTIVALFLVIVVLLILIVVLFFCLKKYGFLQKRLAENRKMHNVEVNILN